MCLGLVCLGLASLVRFSRLGLVSLVEFSEWARLG